MNLNRPAFVKPVLVGVVCIATLWLPLAYGQERQIPKALEPWTNWVTWNDTFQGAPTLYRSADERIAVWPSTLEFRADETSADWSISVLVFAKSWLELPGSPSTWPLDVKAGERALPVVERNGRPAVQLEAGKHELTGRFQWQQMPQQLDIPRAIGVISLQVDGQPVEVPRWDANGHVWLKRTRAEQAERDLLAAKVYRVLEDGIPTRLFTDIELTVSGKSREEDLGWVLPEGFQLSTVESPLPVAVDERGRMKAQVRAGKWTIHVLAFRLQNISEVRFAEDSQPIIDSELIAFRAKPQFRLAEIEGMPTVDVTQTSFPQAWRQLPLYQWDTRSPFQIVEKMRGMGLQKPAGLRIERQFWLDEDGQAYTFQDRIAGQMQQIWRLDVADGHSLGAVRVDGEGQLITTNPATGAQGVELRSRNLNVVALGRIEQPDRLQATGWQSDVDSLSAEFILPPGWRAFAVFGADRVDGDWLTAWSLLDLFLLLVFALAVFRMRGIAAGLLAFVAYGLAYHEPGAPRLTWLFLLMPIALLQVVPDGTTKKLVAGWKYLAITLLALNLVPFVVQQVQSAMYPQLEIAGVNYAPRPMFTGLGATYRASARMADVVYESRELYESQTAVSDGALQQPRTRFSTSNLKQEPAARIQTGPAEPQWSWNLVRCAWDGPVSSQQSIRPVLIPMTVHRLLSTLRVLMLLALAATLLGLRPSSLPWMKKAATAVVCLLVLGLSQETQAAEFPDAQMLNTLRERILQPADVYPNAADIAHVHLQIEGTRVTMTAEVHAAANVAVPLPGKLPVWSPVGVSIDDQPAELVCRKEDYLWVLVPQGVHRVVVESLLPSLSDWEWTYALKPRRVSVTAPEWTVTGIGRDQVPDQQLLFSRQQPTTDGVAAYDQKAFEPIVIVDRHLEIGLNWQVRTVVSRLSAESKALSLNIPLLEGESVLTPNTRVDDRRILVALSAGQQSFEWNSELPIDSTVPLTTNASDTWIERWHLVMSPVWNMTQTGLAPIFEADQQSMIPAWHPWPGEQTTLTFHKPEAVEGNVLTVQQVDHTVTLGNRQRTSTLDLNIECSIGTDFLVALTENAEVTTLVHDGQNLPVRQGPEGLIVPLRPGRQKLEIAWNTNKPLSLETDTGRVTLPVAGSNVSTTMHVPSSRWVLWARGPLRGPAVRFWTVLVTAILIALVLGAVPNSPLRRFEWVLLAIGLTQVHVIAASIVVAWLFALALRGKLDPEQLAPWQFNLRQIGIVLLTIVALSTLVVVVGQGLLGNPDMFIIGNQSTRTYLSWFQPRTDTTLPVGEIVSVSVLFYRLFMLFWALWLAAALLRWLKFGWNQFSAGRMWKRKSEFVTATVVEAEAE